MSLLEDHPSPLAPRLPGQFLIRAGGRPACWSTSILHQPLASPRCRSAGGGFLIPRARGSICSATPDPHVSCGHPLPEMRDVPAAKFALSSANLDGEGPVYSTQKRSPTLLYTLGVFDLEEKEIKGHHRIFFYPL